MTRLTDKARHQSEEAVEMHKTRSGVYVAKEKAKGFFASIWNGIVAIYYGVISFSSRLWERASKHPLYIAAILAMLIGSFFIPVIFEITLILSLYCFFAVLAYYTIMLVIESGKPWEYGS